MQQVNLNLPVNTVMGYDALERLAGVCAGFGNRAFLACSTESAEAGLNSRLEKLLAGRGISCISYERLGADATASAVDEAASLAAAGKAQVIIGAGGPGSLSAARTVALLAPSGTGVYDFMDGTVPKGYSLPFIGVPSSCRDPFMFRDSVMLSDGRNRECRLVPTGGVYGDHYFIDPDLGSGITPRAFGFTVIDTLMYAVEGYFSTSCNFLSESLFLKAVSAVVTADRKLAEEHFDRETYLKAARAGLVTAMGLSMAGPGIGAALSLTIGSRFRVPRALVSAMLLPHVLEYGIRACPDKVARIAPILNEDTSGMAVVDAAERVVDVIRHRVGLRQIPMRLSELGVGSGDLPVIADSVRSFDFLAQLPVPMASEDIVDMLKRVL